MCLTAASPCDLDPAAGATRAGKGACSRKCSGLSAPWASPASGEELEPFLVAFSHLAELLLLGARSGADRLHLILLFSPEFWVLEQHPPAGLVKPLVFGTFSCVCVVIVVIV